MKTTSLTQKRSKDSPGAIIHYKPQGRTLAEFHKRKEFVRIVIGPLGSGKTMGAIHDMLNRIHTQTPNKQGVRKSRWCVARNSFPDLNAATIPDFREITDQLPYGEFTMGSPPKWAAKYPRSDGTTVEATVLFRSFDGPQDVRKARGMQLTGVLVDELAEFNKENFDMLIGRVKRFPKRAEVKDAKFYVNAISNSCARDHWLAKMALEQVPPGWWIGVQPGAVQKVGNAWVLNAKAENLHNLPPGYYEEQVGGKKESWIRQNLANEFVTHSDGRPIHPDFNEQMHVADVSPMQGVPLHLGMDWGRTPACAVLQRQPSGQWLVLEEICLQNAGADKLGRRVKAVLNERYANFMVHEATGDPAGSAMSQTRDETPIELFELTSGLTAMPATSNDPELRYAVLDDLLTTMVDGEPSILIDRSCQLLIRGLAGEYCFKRLQVAGEDRYRDNPDKGPTSHICEALHYGLMGAGEGEALFEQAWHEDYDNVDSWMPDRRYFE